VTRIKKGKRVAKKPFLTRLKLMLNGTARDNAGAKASGQNAATDVQPKTRSQPAFDYADERIPTASRPRIETIQKLITEIEEQAKLTTQGRDALEEARRIERTYLPDLMNSYFLIPPAHRAEIFRRTDRSASFQLNERVDTMIEELRRISAGFAEGQIDSFSVNLRFIDKRFQDPTDSTPFS
jgi:hypothetical protein